MFMLFVDINRYLVYFLDPYFEVLCHHGHCCELFDMVLDG